MEDFSELKAKFDIALLNDVYPSIIIYERDLREIMQNFLRANSNETQCFIHLVKTFIAYILTVCRLEPNMVSVNGIFFAIENWLKELLF